MHVARGGWLGQTFALAKFDDSFEGKKSGIRRSKEERKGMIETYIKRYQKLNNGDFPSLNLTRKEVGGSFYKVREIVREIIQENRVLGPPKSSPQDQNMDSLDSFLEHNPLGSMSIDLQVHSVPPTHVTVNNEAFEKPNNTELLMGEEKDEVDELVANQTQKHQILEDVEVVTSPLGHVASIVHNLDEKSNEREVEDGLLKEENSNEREVLDGDLEEKETDVVDVQMEEEITTHQLPESKSMLTSQKAENRSSTKENMVVDVNGNTDIKLESTLLAEEKQTVNGANVENIHSKTSCISVQQSTLDEKRSEKLNKSSDQLGGNSQKRRTNATLNRINLESWKAASKKSNVRETHGLVTFIRAFITAFVKFWTE